MIHKNHTLVLNGVVLKRNLSIDEVLSAVDEFGLYAGGPNDPMAEAPAPDAEKQPRTYQEWMEYLAEDEDTVGDVPSLPEVQSIAMGAFEAYRAMVQA